MFLKNGKRIRVLIILLAGSILVGIAGLAKAISIPGNDTSTIADEPNALSGNFSTSCETFPLWNRTHGPSRPDLASEVITHLQNMRVNAQVSVREYGEQDGCGHFYTHELDFEVRLLNSIGLEMSSDQMVYLIYTVLQNVGTSQSGRVTITLPDSRTVYFNGLVERAFLPLILHEEDNPLIGGFTLPALNWHLHRVSARRLKQLKHDLSN